MIKPQKQLLKHDPDNGIFGDCYRTCMAIIMGLEAGDVPHFCDGGKANDSGVERAREWLAPKGFGIHQTIYKDDVPYDQVLFLNKHFSPNVPIIITGKGSRGVNHCVVAVNGKTVCDPTTGEPNANPFSGPAENGDEKYWWVEVIAKLPMPLK